MKEKIKIRFSKLWKEIVNLVAAYPELLAIPVLFFVIMRAGKFIRENIDETAAILDAGVLSNLLYAALALLVASIMAFIGIKLNFKQAWNSYKKSQALEVLSSNERSSLHWFYILFISIIAVFAALVNALV